MNWWFIIGVTVAGILCLIKVIVDRQGKSFRERLLTLSMKMVLIFRLCSFSIMDRI